LALVKCHHYDKRLAGPDFPGPLGRWALAAILFVLATGCSGTGPDTVMGLFDRDKEKKRVETSDLQPSDETPSKPEASEPPSSPGPVVIANPPAPATPAKPAGGSESKLSLMSEKDRKSAEAELMRLAKESEQRARAGTSPSEAERLKKLQRRHAEDAQREIDGQ